MEVHSLDDDEPEPVVIASKCNDTSHGASAEAPTGAVLDPGTSYPCPLASRSRSAWSQPTGTTNAGSTAPSDGSHEAPQPWSPAAETMTTGPSSRERTRPSFLNDAIIAVQTAMTRAKLQTLISIELALEGDGTTAQQQLIATLDACNNEVHALRRRTHALAGSQPRLAAVRSKVRQAADSVGKLDQFFDNGVLDLLPERVEANTPIELPIPVATHPPGHGSFQDPRPGGDGEGSRPTTADAVGSLPNR